ncbi:MAG: hypothetical protein ACUVTQ_07195 [Desulfotomaculales bacterium]
MQEVLVEVAVRLKDAGERMAQLVLKRAETSDRLHKLLDAMKTVETEVAGQVAAETNGNGGKKYPNEAARNAEVQARLAANQEYQAMRQQVDVLRQQLWQLDAEIEKAKQQARADNNLVYLVAGLIQGGRWEMAEAVLAAYRKETPKANGNGREQHLQNFANAVNAVANGTPAQEQKAGSDTLEAVVTVLEVRPGSKPGVIRAYCQTQDGDKVAVYGKNGAGKKPAASVGEVVTVRYRELDKGWFAVAVK